MGNLLSKNNYYKPLPESIWGYKSVSSTVKGLYLSSIPDGNGGFITRLFRQDDKCNRSTVWFRRTSVQPTTIETFYRENEPLRVVFMIGEERAGIDNVVWETNDFKINEKDNTLVFLKKKNKKSSPSQSAIGAGASAGAPEVSTDATYPNGLPVDISRQVASGNVVPLRRSVPDVKANEDFRLEEPDRTANVVKYFSGQKHNFFVSKDGMSICYNLKSKNTRSSPNHVDFGNPVRSTDQVQLGIINISSLTVHELSEGVYLIMIHTSLGQTYLSGYLSTNATPIFTTFQITSNLDDKRFKSFEHVSGTVFKCFFSDDTEKTFSIEAGSYATIKELLET